MARKNRTPLPALLLLAAGALGCPTPAWPPGTTTMVTVGVPNAQDPTQNVTREFRLHVPASYSPGAAGAALHLSFHGLNDNCVNQMHSTGLKELSDARGFVFATPCGTIGGGPGPGGVGWNSGTCCGFANDSKIDDFAFARVVVDYLSARLCVDPTRVYASGFSNGAMMAEVLACRSAATFRAVASVSGVVELRPGNLGGLAACDAAVAQAQARRAAVLNVHGTADVVVPWTGDAIFGFPPIPDDFAAWANRSGCTGAPVQTFSRGPYSNQVYQACADGAQVELVRHQGGVHQWPIDSNFNTTAYIQEFFDRFV